VREQQDLDEAFSKHVKQKYEKVALSQKVLADLKARQQAELATGKVRRGSLACTCFQCQGCMSTSSLQAGCTAGAGRVCRGSLAWTCFHVPGVREAQACKWGAISTQQLHSSRLGVELSHSRLVTCMVCEVLGCWLLFAGCRSLVAGRWLLVAGCWLLVAGCWLLVAGRWSLAGFRACELTARRQGAVPQQDMHGRGADRGVHGKQGGPATGAAAAAASGPSAKDIAATGLGRPKVRHACDAEPGYENKFVASRACHSKLVAGRAVCYTGCCAQARALTATSRGWPVTSHAVTLERRMPTPDPAVHDLAPVPTRAGSQAVGGRGWRGPAGNALNGLSDSTGRICGAHAPGNQGCALFETWLPVCRRRAGRGVVREGAVAAACCQLV